MMSTKRWIQIVFSLAVAGLIFSGYLSSVKLLSGSCAFNETCPYFLGYPACWYGFVMYLVMVVATGLGLLKKINDKKVFITDIVVSAIGIIFTGSFVMQEVAQSRLTGALGLSTCVYGLIFYLLIFAVSIIGSSRTGA